MQEEVVINVAMASAAGLSILFCETSSTCNVLKKTFKIAWHSAPTSNRQFASRKSFSLVLPSCWASTLNHATMAA